MAYKKSFEIMGSLCVKYTYSLHAYIYFNELLATEIPITGYIYQRKIITCCLGQLFLVV